MGTIISSTARHNVPAIYEGTLFARRGGLIAYGASFTDMFRRAAVYVDRILRGERPADLPVRTPTKFELIINLKTAKALGLNVPPALLATADEVDRVSCSRPLLFRVDLDRIQHSLSSRL